MSGDQPTHGYKEKSYYDEKNYRGHEATPIDTLDSPLMIEVAPTGSFIMRDTNPNQPYTADEVAAEVNEALDAGASIAHLHVRDEEGYPDQSPETIVGTIERIQAEHDPVVTMNVRSNTEGATFGRPLLEETIGVILEEHGTDYVDMITTSPLGDALDPQAPFVMNRDILTEWVEYLQDNGLKPELQAYSYKAYERVNDWIVEPGVLDPPYYMNATTGHHAYYSSGPTQPHPWGTMYLATMQQTQPFDDDEFVHGAIIGGRNWLPMTVEAILLGYDLVRIGMEDTVYMYPHRDEKIEHCREVVEKIVTVCNALGREVATSEQAREILDL